MKKLFCLLLILMSTHIFGAFEVFDFSNGVIGITTDSTDNNAYIMIQKHDGKLYTIISLFNGEFSSKELGERFKIKITGDNKTELEFSGEGIKDLITTRDDALLDMIKNSNYITTKITRTTDNKTWNFRFSCAGYTKNIGKVKEKK